MVRTAILILAAGNSSRLGQSKQMLEIDGMPMLYATVREAVVSKADHVQVILGAQYLRHKALIDDFFDVSILRNEDWDNGIGYSVKIGLLNLRKRYPGLQKVIISACDQPELSTKVFNQLLAIPEEGVMASFYSNNEYGFPFSYGKNVLDKIHLIPEKDNTRALLELNGKVSFAPFENGHIDINTIADYHNYIALQSHIDNLYA